MERKDADDTGGFLQYLVPFLMKSIYGMTFQEALMSIIKCLSFSMEDGLKYANQLGSASVEMLTLPQTSKHCRTLKLRLSYLLTHAFNFSVK